MQQPAWRLAVLGGLLVTGTTVLSLAAEPSSSQPQPKPAATTVTAEQAQFFETSIRPVLIQQCQKCHGETQQSGGLRVDSRDALLKGGTRGASVVPGQPERSALLASVLHQDGAPKMPPGKKLSDRDVAALTRWIQMGAPWPNGKPIAPQKGATHWAFQPIRAPKVPVVRNRAWVKTPIDAFILAKLEAKGVKPAPPADRRTLIRRATFDLTGLPPTPEEVTAFVNDPSPDAWAKVIDRLLASPAYGERWGRHWLDVARYADSNGLDENVHYGNAWRYRDYVIRSFNADKPFNRFITEQLAGDLLPAGDTATRHEQLIATGFLAVGPKFISEVDTEKVLMDLVDEQVDTVGRAFMGMTFGCARCHDHKFDPISTKDYYALAGVFKSTKTLQVLKKPRMWFEHSLASEADLARKAEHEKQVAAQKERIAALVAEATAAVKTSQPEGKTLPKNVEPLFPEATRAELQRLRAELTTLEKNPPVMPAAMGVTDGTVADLPIHIRGSHLTLGEVVPRGVPVILAGHQPPKPQASTSGRLEVAQWITSPENPLTTRVIANRIWRWHFGRAIVASTDNFGLLSEDPSHPELLDWLAIRFREEGWSFKRMHRLVMLSNTYQMSDRHDPHAAKVDPENRLQWRWNRRRLEAEELRDGILAVSGMLDQSKGGPALALKNREYVFDHTSRDSTQYDSLRRAVYLPVVRNNVYDVFQLFDFGDASVPVGDRPTTTIAPQALFMMNSDLVFKASQALAKRLPATTPEKRVERLYLHAYGRNPSAAETERAITLLGRLEQSQQTGTPAERKQQAWTWLCQVLLASNEFVYLR